MIVLVLSTYARSGYDKESGEDGKRKVPEKQGLGSLAENESSYHFPPVEIDVPCIEIS